MQLNLKKSTENQASNSIFTTVNEVYQVNPMIEVHVINYIHLHAVESGEHHNFNPVRVIEQQDWETTYYIAGEECKHDGVKELLNKLFKDLSYDKIEDAIRDLPESRFSEPLSAYNLINNLPEKTVNRILDKSISKASTLTDLETGMVYTRNWEVRAIAEALNDSRLQTITVYNREINAFVISK